MGCLIVATAIENKSLAALSNCSRTTGVSLILLTGVSKQLPFSVIFFANSLSQYALSKNVALVLVTSKTGLQVSNS